MLNNIRVEYLGREIKLLNPNESGNITPLPHFAVIRVLGECTAQINGESINLPKDSILILPPQCNFTFMSLNSEIKAECLLLNIEADNKSAEALYSFPNLPNKEATEALNPLLNSLFSADDICDIMSISYQITKILLSTATKKKRQDNNPLTAVLNYINESYSEKITISSLARLANMSQSNLYAAFKKRFGASPVSYLNDYRLLKASQLLKATKIPLSEICKSVGIEDMRYFSKIFKRKYNSTPSAYRKNTLI